MTLQVGATVRELRPIAALSGSTEPTRKAVKVNHLVNILNLRRKCESQLRFYGSRAVNESVTAGFTAGLQKKKLN